MERVCCTCKHAKTQLSKHPCNKCGAGNPNWEPQKAEPDIINQPAHYTGRGGIKPLDFITSNKLDFFEGSIVKYVYRYPFKGGVEDLKKARRFLDKMIERLEGEQNG